MKEYEYIAEGIENFLVDELVSVICQENLERKTYEHGFRRLFDNYRILRDNYLTQKDDFMDPNREEANRVSFFEDCKVRREVILDKFLDDVDANYPELHVRKLVEDYCATTDKDDVLPTEKRVCIYPYIISQIRLYKEGGV